MKKNQFEFSHEIIELNQFYNNQATEFAKKLRGNTENFFLEIECSPNGQLNPFYYGNGLESAKLIQNHAGVFMGKDFDYLKEKIKLSQTSNFVTDFSLGEKLNLWERVGADDYQEKLDWSQPFCIKNKTGITKIWHPNWRQIGYNMGFSTRGSITTFLHENQTYFQKFYAPLAAPSLSLQHRMHYRLIFCLSEIQKEPEFIGGLWISRVGFKIYPGKGSVVGLIAPSKS